MKNTPRGRRRMDGHLLSVATQPPSRLPHAPPGHGEARRERHPWRIALALGLATFTLYCANLRQMGSGDTYGARLIPFSLLQQGNMDLDEFPWLRSGERLPYYLRRGSGGHLYSIYPPATPLLVTPLALPFAAWIERHRIDPDDVRFRLATVLFERIAAAAIGAAGVVLLYLAALSLCSTRCATAIALAYAFTTSAWVISGQGLWQHGLASLSVAGTSAALMGAPGSAAGALLAGVAVSLGVAVRPTMVLFAAVTFLFIVRYRPHHLGWFLLLPFLSGIALALYNLEAVGRLSGGYRHWYLTWPHAINAAGLLLSPSRGLIIYSPAVLLAPVGLLFYRGSFTHWLRALGLFCLAYLLLYSGARRWWGGHTFGPRYLVELLPALALCAVPAVQRLARSRPWRAVMAAALLWGACVQGIGVFFDVNDWNLHPNNVDLHPQRLWDWSDSQIVREARSGWHGLDLAPLLRQALFHPVPALLRPLDTDRASASIERAEASPQSCPPASTCVLRARISNHGTVAWPAWSDVPGMQVGLLPRWFADGRPLPALGDLVHLPRNLAPGRQEEVRLRVQTPDQAGRYTLSITVLQVRDAASGISLGPPLEWEVQVR